MPSRQLTNPPVAAKAPISTSRYAKSYALKTLARREVFRNRIVSYQESDSDEDVIYVGQRKKTRPQALAACTQPTVRTPAFTYPTIILSEEDLTVQKKPKREKKYEVADVVEVVDETAGPTEPVTNCRAIFQTLPYEIHQNVVKYFQQDSDVVNYAKLCKQTRDSISSSVWRGRFVRTFDMPDGELGVLALAKKYAYRRDISGWICFDYKKFGYIALSRGEKKIQEENVAKCLLILRDLIVESNARRIIGEDGKQVVEGLNHDYIRDWVKPGGRRHTDVLEAILNTEQTSWSANDIVSARTNGSLVLVIQLCLTWLSLNPESCTNTVSHFDLSQKEAYADFHKQPVFVGGWKQDINVRWLLHTVNFFKLHLKASAGEGLLAQHFAELNHDQVPQPWVGKISEGTQPIGSHWKSAYTFMKDNQTLQQLRLHGNDEEPMVDDGELFSDISIFFDEDKFPSHSWPTALETLIKSNPYAAKVASPRSRQTRSANAVGPIQHELKSFYGTSLGFRQAHFFGRIHGLPEQQGIPGFQRISLVKFYPLEGEYDPRNVWAYEGCVLPGRRIMIGRWWDLTADQQNPVGIFGGPFIWWNVDESAAEFPISSEEALEFLDSIHDPNIGF